MVADRLSRIILNRNEVTKHKYNYQKEKVSEINDNEEIPKGTFLINLKLIQKYQQLEPSITAKYKDHTYQKGSFLGGSNTDLKIIMCKYNILIPSILQIYVVYWYHTYLLHPGMDRTEEMI